MSLQLDLSKSAQTLRLSLDKQGVTSDVKAELVFNLDVSGSFEHEHEEGTTSVLVQRLVPYGMVLDPDGVIDVFTFSGGENSAHYVGTVTPDDAEGYVTRNIVGRVPGWAGGTDYSYVLEMNLKHFGWLDRNEQHGKGGSWWSRFWGTPEEPQVHRHAQKRSIVVHVSDGENDRADYSRTMRVLEDSEQRGDNVYFLMVGACEHDVDFRFMKDAAKRFKNTGFVEIRDLEAFVELSDEAMSAQLLNAELISWLKN